MASDVTRELFSSHPVLQESGFPLGTDSTNNKHVTFLYTAMSYIVLLQSFYYKTIKCVCGFPVSKQGHWFGCQVQAQ